MPREEFAREVEKELTGRDSEPSELIYFKVYKSQAPVIEQALGHGSADAGFRQVAGVLSGDDLRGFPGWSSHRERRSQDPIVFHASAVPLSACAGETTVSE